VAYVYVLMPLCVYAYVFRTQQNLCQGNICLYVFMSLCRVFLILGMLQCCRKFKFGLLVPSHFSMAHPKYLWGMPAFLALLQLLR
jgi:hypothetical protein